MTMRMRYLSFYISLPSSAKEKRKIPKFCLVGETRTIRSIFRISICN